MNRQDYYAAGLPFGDSATRHKPGGRVYGGGGGGDSTSSSKIEYPEEIKPLLRNVASLSDDLYATPFQAYNSERFAGLNNIQQQALQGQINRAVSGSPIMGSANQNLMELMGNQQNPYLDQQVQAAQQSVLDNYNQAVKPQTEAAQVGSGSFGNSGLQQMQLAQQSQLQQNLGNVAAGMYGDAFAQNQQNRLQALGFAQPFANQDYADLSQILDVGNVLQDQAQNQADFNYDEFMRQQDDPFRKLQAMTGVMQGTAGSTTTTTGGGK